MAKSTQKRDASSTTLKKGLSANEQGTSSSKALFIIESLRLKDEESRREGEIIRQILRLSDEQVRYMYIRTRRELKLALKEFRKSHFRYLHISCHGDRKSLALTLDTLSFDELAQELRPFLKRRRVFFSACEVVNEALASKILPGSGCHSIVGPSEDIRFDDALLMWASFYHLAFRDKDPGLQGGKVRWILRRVKHTFGIEFLYFRSKGSTYESCDINIR